MAIDNLLLYVDFMMWLRGEYQNSEQGTMKVSLVNEPRQAIEAAVDEFLDCCKGQFDGHLANVQEGIDKDRKIRIEFLRSEPIKDLRKTAKLWNLKTDGKKADLIKRIEKHNNARDQKYFREDVKDEMEIPDRAVFVRVIVSREIVNCLHEGADVQGEYEATLNEIAGSLKILTEDEAAKLYDIFNQAAFLHLDVRNPFCGRRKLLPKGNTTSERYADYLQVRQWLCDTDSWFKGMGKGHPEFTEIMGEPTDPKKFSQPISVNLSAPKKKTPYKPKKRRTWLQVIKDECPKATARDPKDPDLEFWADYLGAILWPMKLPNKTAAIEAIKKEFECGYDTAKKLLAAGRKGRTISNVVKVVVDELPPFHEKAIKGRGNRSRKTKK